MTAAGAYLRTLREARGFSRAEIADRLGATETNLWRIEEDGQEPRVGLFLGFIREVRGSVADFRRLLFDEHATDVAGRELAHLRLSRMELDQIEELRDLLGDEALVEVTSIFASDPGLIEALGRIGGAFADSRRRQRE